MSGEGLSKLFSPEWIRATATVIPVLLAMWWVLKLQGMLWRRTVWQGAGVAATTVGNTLSAPVRARWLGFEVRTEAARVSWVGGLRGERTLIRTPDGTQRVAGWLDADAVLAKVSAPR